MFVRYHPCEQSPEPCLFAVYRELYHPVFPSHIGTIISRYKDPYEAISIMECHSEAIWTWLRPEVEGIVPRAARQARPKSIHFSVAKCGRDKRDKHDHDNDCRF